MFFSIQKMCGVDQEIVPSSAPRAGCRHWAVGPCPLACSPAVRMSQYRGGCGGEGDWEGGSGDQICAEASDVPK